MPVSPPTDIPIASSDFSSRPCGASTAVLAWASITLASIALPSIALPSIASAQTASYPSPIDSVQRNVAPTPSYRVTYPDPTDASTTNPAAMETLATDPFGESGNSTNGATKAQESTDVMLQKEIDSLEAERAILKVQLGDGHPSVQVFDARINAARRALANVRRRNATNDASQSASATDQAGLDDDEAFPAPSENLTDAQTQQSIKQLQRVVRILAERVIALETEVAKLKQ
jgi:hypothetical protein